MMTITTSRARRRAATAALGLLVLGSGLAAGSGPATAATSTATASAASATAASSLGGRPEGAAEVSTAAFTRAGVHYGGTITRKTMMIRANDWLKRNVPYNQSGSAWDVNHGKRYRTDCSGFVSMVWALPESRTTRNLGAVSYAINWNQLMPGDIVLKKGTHVQVFEKWTSSAKSAFWVIEEGSTASDMNHRIIDVVASRGAGYEPRRYAKTAK